MTEDNKALVARLRGVNSLIAIKVASDAADRIEALSAENERLRSALSRQCDNIAFILNHMSIPDNWYEKFTHELKEDRQALGETK